MAYDETLSHACNQVAARVAGAVLWDEMKHHAAVATAEHHKMQHHIQYPGTIVLSESMIGPTQSRSISSGSQEPRARETAIANSIKVGYTVDGLVYGRWCNMRWYKDDYMIIFTAL